MKKMFNLMYCDGLLTTRVVHYIVKVGTSDRDKKAAAQICKRAASDPNLYFHVNDRDGAWFMERIRESIKPIAKPYERYSFTPMRTRCLNVTRMARLIRDIPLPLLNSSAIEHRVA